MSFLRADSTTETYQRIEAILERAEPHLEYPCPKGTVHRAWFLYGLFWSQVGARVNEMNDLGWSISSIALPKSQWRNGIRTAYRLDGKPLQPGEDWFVSQTGKPRPSGRSQISGLDSFALTAPEPRP